MKITLRFYPPLCYSTEVWQQTSHFTLPDPTGPRKWRTSLWNTVPVLDITNIKLWTCLCQHLEENKSPSGMFTFKTILHCYTQNKKTESGYYSCKRQTQISKAAQGRAEKSRERKPAYDIEKGSSGKPTALLWLLSGEFTLPGRPRIGKKSVSRWGH